MLKRLFGIPVVAVLALVVTAHVSVAATCNTSQLTGSTACEGPFSGNDSGNMGISLTDTHFGLTGWTEIDKVDGDSGTDGVLSVTSGGGWSVSSFPGTFETFMIALKGGPTFSLYLLGPGTTAATMGTWNTLSLENGNGGTGPGLSHITLWGTGTPSTVIPLPAGAWLLLTGLVGLGLAKRRKA